MKNAIVLAAGKGTRMKSSENKVMHKILHKPMLGHLVDNLNTVGLDHVVVVTGYEREKVETYLHGRADIAVQEEQIGTADAVKQVTQLKDKSGSTLLLLGDCALIQPETIQSIFDAHEGYDLTLVTAKVPNPKTYRRVIRDNQGHIEKIADARQLTDTETSINEISVGVYCFNNELLFKYVDEIEDDPATDELNIARVVEIMKHNGHSIQAIQAKDVREFLGVNDREQLMEANRWLQETLNARHMANGVTIYDPSSTFIGPNVTIESDVTIYPNNHIYGRTHIQSGAVIYPNNWIDDSHIGKQAEVRSSHLTDATIGEATTVGPNAHLRNHAHVEDHVRIGNFVEIKNSHIGNSSAVAHLTYIGDTNVGKHVNIGCGVVTANYDGKQKHKTTIGDYSFIGSQSTLIAPVEVGENAVVAAGSVINKDVEENALAIARSRQENKPGYGLKIKNKK